MIVKGKRIIAIAAVILFGKKEVRLIRKKRSKKCI